MVQAWRENKEHCKNSPLYGHRFPFCCLLRRRGGARGNLRLKLPQREQLILESKVSVNAIGCARRRKPRVGHSMQELSSLTSGETESRISSASLLQCQISGSR